MNVGRRNADFEFKLLRRLEIVMAFRLLSKNDDVV